MLIYELLKHAGFKVGMAGNVGASFARMVAESDFEYYVSNQVSTRWYV